MRLTSEESRALGFIALLLVLSAAARMIAAPGAIEANLAGVDAAALESAGRAAASAAAQAAQPLGPGERLDLNSAPLEELMRLPRVNRAMAERIVADRTSNGRYRSLADADRISGVGPATLAAWRDHVTLPETGPGGGARAAQPAGASGSGQSAAGVSSESGSPVDLNRATLPDLEKLPGVGPVLAARIIAYRDSVGGFRTIDELIGVSGIGPRVLDRIRPLVRVGPRNPHS